MSIPSSQGSESFTPTASPNEAAGLEISIIVPFNRRSPFLDPCARAIQDRVWALPDVEVLFIDTLSSDAAAALLGRNFPGFRILRAERRNPYAARNLGAGVARGRILAFTDADCAIDPDWISAIRESFSRGAAMATGPVIPAQSASRLLQSLHACENLRIKEMCSSGGSRVAYTYTNNLAIDAALFRALGGFDDSRPRGGDSDFLRRAQARNRNLPFRFHSGMGVMHLEMKSLRTWLAKKFLYGRSGTAGRSPPAGLPHSDKSEPIRNTALLLALGLGRAAYLAGRLSRRI